MEVVNSPSQFYDPSAFFHEHPGLYADTYVCSSGHRWTLTRPGGKQCPACLRKGTDLEVPSFKRESHTQLDLVDLERQKFERRETQRLRQWAKYEADRNILDLLLPYGDTPHLSPLSPVEQHDFLIDRLVSLKELQELKDAYDQKVEEGRHKSLAEEIKEVAEEVGEVVAEGLEATNDVLSQFI